MLVSRQSDNPKPQPPELPDTVYAAWPANGVHNGLIITTMPLTVHVVFTRHQARDIIDAHTASSGAVDAYNQAGALPKHGQDAVRIEGYAASLVADAVRAACAYKEEPPPRPVAPRTLTFFSAPPSTDTNGTNAVCLEVDEAGDAHVYVFFSKNDARAHLNNRIAWTSHGMMALYRATLESSPLPEHDDTRIVQVDGSVAREVVAHMRIYLQALEHDLPIPPP